MANTTPISFDILTAIVDQIALSEDRRSLSRCAHLCQDIRPLCQKHIFFKVTLGDAIDRIYERRKVERLNSLLTESPHLADYIHELRYSFHLEDRQTDNVPKTFRLLHFVRTFYFRNRYQGRLDWTTLPNDMQSAILGIIQTPGLKYLAFHKISEFPLIHALTLPRSTCIDSLHLSSFVIREGDGVSSDNDDSLKPAMKPTSTVSSTCRLSEFRVCSGRSAPPIQALLRPHLNHDPRFIFSTLKRFGVEWRKVDDIDACARVLQVSLELKHLHIVACPWEQLSFCSLAQMLTAGPLESLTTLHIQFLLDERYAEGVPMSTLFGQLSLLGTRNILETLKIEAEVHRLFSNKWAEIAAWDYFTSIITRQKFSHLRMVTLSFMFSPVVVARRVEDAVSQLRKLPTAPFRDICKDVGIDFSFLAEIEREGEYVKWE